MVIYVIRAVCEDAPTDFVAGIATSEEKRDQMLDKLHSFDEEHGSSCFEYEVDSFMTDCLVLNDKIYRF